MTGRERLRHWAKGNAEGPRDPGFKSSINSFDSFMLSLPVVWVLALFAVGFGDLETSSATDLEKGRMEGIELSAPDARPAHRHDGIR